MDPGRAVQTSIAGVSGGQTTGYPTKVQLISQPTSQQWYVNFPNALAQALDLRKGETVEWQTESREVLIMVRYEVPPARKLRTVRPPGEV